MRADMLEAMRLMADRIVSDDAMADLLIREATIREAGGEAYAGQVLRDVARHCRVRTLELGGRLAVMRAEYDRHFHAGPAADE